MTAKEPLRVALVGCGAITQARHIPSLLKIRGVELVATCDKDEELAKRVAERCHSNKYYADLSQMLNREQLDVIDISTPPNTHATLAIEAMDAGCHVLVEKPMALSVKEADEMVSASKRNQVKLCVVHSNLFDPMAMRAKSIISQGGIGDLTGMDIVFSIAKDTDWLANKDHWYRKLPGGAFGELLPHPIYMAMAFLGHLEPVAVYATRLGSYDWVAADELRVIMESENGIATVTSSCNAPRDMFALVFFGTKMNLLIEIRGSVLLTYPRTSLSRPRLEDFRLAFQQASNGVRRSLTWISGRYYSSHHTLIGRFAESIQNGTEPPVTGEQGKEVIRVCEKITAQIDSKGMI